MDIVLYFFRDTLSGIHYFIYAFIMLFLMFSIIGYLLKQKYGKYDIKLATSQVNSSNTKGNDVKNTQVVNQTIPTNDYSK